MPLACVGVANRDCERARARCANLRVTETWAATLGNGPKFCTRILVFIDIRDKKIAIFGPIGATCIHSEALTCLQEHGQTDISCQPPATGMLGTDIRGVSLYTRRPPFEFHWNNCLTKPEIISVWLYKTSNVTPEGRTSLAPEVRTIYRVHSLWRATPSSKKRLHCFTLSTRNHGSRWVASTPPYPHGPSNVPPKPLQYSISET